MAGIYCITNITNNKKYIGKSSNIKRRIRQHKSGSTRTTRILQTFTLVYKEKFSKIEDARHREKKLKSYKSRKYIEWLILQDQGR